MIVISEATLMTLIQLAAIKAVFGWPFALGVVCLAAAYTVAGVSVSGLWELHDYNQPLPEGATY